jgi:SEC-C motif domain protein
MEKDPNLPCPCCSGKLYSACCEVYHQGQAAKTAKELMRSRYSAYALHHVDYIIRTTFPRHAAVSHHLDTWKKEVFQFCLSTTFEKLEILKYKELPDRATVIFIAHLKQGETDATFTERSYFAKVDGVWYYVNGDTYPGENRSLKL